MDICARWRSRAPLAFFNRGQCNSDARLILSLSLFQKFFFVAWHRLCLHSAPLTLLLLLLSIYISELVSMAEEGVTVTAPGGQEGLTAGGHKREEWSSRWAFYFAGVGAAVGFGKFDEKYDEKHQLFAYQ